MKNKKEIQEWLREVNLTEEEEVQAMWDRLALTNKKVNKLIEAGVKWQNMGRSVIKSIPYQREKDLAFS